MKSDNGTLFTPLAELTAMTLLNRLSLTTKTRLPVLIVLIIMSSVVAVAYTSLARAAAG